MRRLFAFLLLASVPAAPAAEVPPGPAKAATAAENAGKLMAAYRESKDAVGKYKTLVALRDARSEAVNKFLEEEWERLDMDLSADAKLGGAILQTWAAHRDPERLPVLLFEGLFHDDAEVVRACADAAAKLEAATRSTLSIGRAPAGREPHQEMAVDLITRMMERRDLTPSLEKVLAAWSGKHRPDEKPDAKLDEVATTAVIEFWKKWYEERFRTKFKPANDVAPADKKTK